MEPSDLVILFIHVLIVDASTVLSSPLSSASCPLPDEWQTLSNSHQRLSGPSSSFVSLRGLLF